MCQLQEGNSRVSVKKHKYPEIDMIRAIGIILVLIGHSNILPQGKNGSGEWFIALFHVVIFYIAAGFVFNEESALNIENVFLDVKRKMEIIYLPFVAWNIFFEIVMCFRGHKIESMKIFHIFLIVETSDFAATTWFLIAIFWISIVFIFISFLLNSIFKETRAKVIIHLFIAVGMLWGGFIMQSYIPQWILFVLYGYIMYFFGEQFRIIIQKCDDLKMWGGYFSNDFSGCSICHNGNRSLWLLMV